LKEPHIMIFGKSNKMNALLLAQLAVRGLLLSLKMRIVVLRDLFIIMNQRLQKKLEASFMHPELLILLTAS